VHRPSIGEHVQGAAGRRAAAAHHGDIDPLAKCGRLTQ
jgi:hypothetical protein